MVVGVITQNVDRLHHAAGSERVVELHGALADVRCLDCGAKSAREALQQQLLELNPGLVEDARFELAPDGDADPIEDLDEQRFRVPLCAACGAGVLKPDVVFFGESVPRERVDRAWAIYEQAELLLVVGSSLAVFSGFRFPRRAAREGRDVAIVNLGPTRADDLCRLKLAARVGDVLPRLARALTIPADDGSAAS